MDLKDIPTCELMKELEKREGVEKIFNGPEGTDHIVMTDPDQDLYDMKREGPCIILRIID